MDCQAVRERLSVWIDGELVDHESREIGRHLEECPSCRREHEQLQALRPQLQQSLAPPPISDGEWEQIVLRAVSRHSERFGWALLIPGATALLVGAAVVFYTDPEVPPWIRTAAGLITAGFSFLIASAITERWRARRFERYERVER